MLKQYSLESKPHLCEIGISLNLQIDHFSTKYLHLSNNINISLLRLFYINKNIVKVYIDKNVKFLSNNFIDIILQACRSIE